MKPFEEILSRVSAYYGAKIAALGPTPQGVDWNSAESQHTRFRQLMRLCDGQSQFTLNDYGCGYGALLDYLEQQDIDLEYRGFDIAPDMINRAQKLHSANRRATFHLYPAELNPADYTVASGIFNVKLESSEEEWRKYVLHTLDNLAGKSERGFAFNMLTSYSDPERMRPNLYYADPCYYFAYCKRNFSRHVALLHDYGLYEFTLLVRHVA